MLSFAKFDAIWKIIEASREILATKSVKTFQTWKQRTFYAILYHWYEFHNPKSLRAITNVNSKIKRFLLSMIIVMFSSWWRFTNTCFHLKDRAGTSFAIDSLHHGHSKSFPVVIIATILLCKSLFCTMMHESRGKFAQLEIFIALIRNFQRICMFRLWAFASTIVNITYASTIRKIKQKVRLVWVEYRVFKKDNRHHWHNNH